MLTHDTGIVADVYALPQARGCAATDCPAVLAAGDSCFMDDRTSRRYCVPCGQRLRYHRRRALERSGSFPLTLDDVERR
jgi:hypothetical protein